MEFHLGCVLVMVLTCLDPLFSLDHECRSAGSNTRAMPRSLSRTTGVPLSVTRASSIISFCARVPQSPKSSWHNLHITKRCFELERRGVVLRGLLQLGHHHPSISCSAQSLLTSVPQGGFPSTHTPYLNKHTRLATAASVLYRQRHSVALAGPQQLPHHWAPHSVLPTHPQRLHACGCLAA